MPGGFSKSNLPKRPGAYFNFESRPVEVMPIPTQGVVAIPFTHDWGPVDTPVRVRSFSEWESIYGTGLTEGRIAVQGAFKGEGVNGRGGAAEVVALRFAGTSAAKATRILQNTTPAAALTLTAKYEGTKGNALRATVAANAADPTNKNDLIILDGTVEVERWTHTKTDITGLAAAINAGSDWVTAGSVTSGVALSAVSAQAFTGGDDGTTLVAGDWTGAMTALESERFAIFAPMNLSDSAIQTSMSTWAKNLNANSKRFMLVLGGAAGENLATAQARATAANDPNIVTLGIGTYKDEIADANRSTAQLAPRLAGIIADRGETRNLTFARMADLSIVTGPSDSDIIASLDTGVMVMARDSHGTAPVRIEAGRTTYTTTSDTNKPFHIYRVPKFVRVMQGLELQLNEYAEANVIGQLPVNNDTRAFLIGIMKGLLADREADGRIQPGWDVQVDSSPPPSDQDEFIALLYQISFGRSLEQILNTVVVS